MRKLMITLVSIVLVSCTSKPENQKMSGLKTNDPILENSFWVNEKYLDALKKTNSAQQSKQFADTALVSFNSKADTATIVWNFHESSAYIVKRGAKIQLFDAYAPKPTADFEITVSNKRLLIGNSAFVQIENGKIAENLFLAGKYESKNGEIELTSDGKVLGIDSLESYSVWTDYITMETEIDGMDFTSKKGNTTFLGYTKTNDEVIFYDFIWKDEVYGKKGKERFRLKRIK